MSYVIYDKETTKLLSSQRYKTVPAAKAALTRTAKAEPCRLKGREWAIAEVNDFHENIEKKVTRTNFMSGEEFEEPINTPVYMSPAFESYWSM